MTDELLAPVPEGTDPDAWAEACARVRSACGWHVAPSITETVQVDGTGDELLLLPTLWLTNVTGVTDDTTAVTAPEWKRNGAVRPGWTEDQPGDRGSGRWGRSWGRIQLTITHGHPSCPEDLLAVTRAIANSGAMLASIPGRGRMVAGPFQAELDDILTPGQLDTLAKYALPPRP